MNINDNKQWTKERSDIRFKQDLLISMFSNWTQLPPMSRANLECYVVDSVKIADQIVKEFHNKDI